MEIALLILVGLALMASSSDGGGLALGGSSALSLQGLSMLKGLEGFSHEKYWDRAQWSIGYGSKWNSSMPSWITEEQGEQILASQIVGYSNTVQAGVSVPLSQSKRDALIMICYNIGPGGGGADADPGFLDSTFLKRINEGASVDSIVDAILWWNKPPEIIGRRQKEANLFRSGVYV
jgi:lysozyme